MDTRVGIRLSSHWMGGHKARLRRKEYPLDTRTDRRAFLKNAALAGAALMVAPVALGAAEPKKALADGGNCNANAYCEPTEYMIKYVIGIDKAYLTNSTVPESIFKGPWPNTPVEGDNASYEAVDGGYNVTIDLVNTVFTLTSVDDESSSTKATIVSKDESAGYISQLVVFIPEDEKDEVHTFTASEHASLSPVSGTKNWPLNIVVSI